MFVFIVFYRGNGDAIKHAHQLIMALLKNSESELMNLLPSANETKSKSRSTTITSSNDRTNDDTSKTQRTNSTTFGTKPHNSGKILSFLFSSVMNYTAFILTDC